MTEITSRKNQIIAHVRKLNEKRTYRYQCGQFVCDGLKLYKEALSAGAEIVTILLRRDLELENIPKSASVYLVDGELLQYASRLESASDMLFVCTMPDISIPETVCGSMIVADGVQDPGNVGTILRTAEAFSIEAVALLEGCADPFNPKTVRSTMGAVFRQKFFLTQLDILVPMLKAADVPLYASALSDRAVSVKEMDLKGAAVAVGSEGSGVSRTLLDACDGEIIIPMSGQAESLNAGIAAGILMWEMTK